jgi:hypothetical protein
MRIDPRASGGVTVMKQVVLLDEQHEIVATFERSFDEMAGVHVVKHNGIYYRNQVMTAIERTYYSPTRVVDLDDK